MNLFDLPFEQFLQFLIVFIRITTILFLVPFFGDKSIPLHLRIGLGFLVSIIIYPFVDFKNIVLPSKLIHLAILAGGEVVIGIVIGYATRLVFTSILIAGHLMGFQIGFGIVNVMDPQTESQISIIAKFESVVTMLFFLSTGAYYIFLRAISDSFSLIPPLGVSFSASSKVLAIIMGLFSNIFIIAIKLSAPVIAALIFSMIALGLIARTVPQINIFIVGIPIQIGIGLFMIGVVLSYMDNFLQNLFGKMEMDIYSLFRALTT